MRQIFLPFTKEVLLEGRLGNQLWHLAFAHYLLRSGFSTSLIALKFKNGKSRFDISLLRLVMQNCNHAIKVVEKNYESIESRRRYVRASRYFRFLSFNKQIIIAGKANPFEFGTEELQRAGIFVGQFQNTDIMKEDLSIVASELLKLLNEYKASSGAKLMFSRDRPVIHFRFGDYLEKRHKDVFGLLDDNYYETIIEKMNVLPKDCLLLTDDPKSVTKYFPKLSGAVICGPEDFNEIQALSIMRDAPVLAISNSTFAWWGGYLALFCGGRVYAPWPFYKEQGIISDSFLPPEFNIVQSSFF